MSSNFANIMGNNASGLVTGISKSVLKVSSISILSEVSRC
jgi:hypothetical protein